MDTFAWDASFVTDLPEVDHQHHALVDLFNELHRNMFSGRALDWLELEVVFHRLLDYANYHFADEMQTMQRVGIDRRHLDLHQHEHQDFVEQLNDIWRLRQTFRQPGATIIGFLTSWLGLHILGVDQVMARQIKLIAQGRTAEEAFAMQETGEDAGRHALLKLLGKLHHVLADQNNDLVRANQHLELRVAERTAQLAKANEELTCANERLQAYSRTDGLLEIANRKYFDERLRLEVARSVRQQQPLGLLMLDVDYFKNYNDTYGHQAGDTCLQAIARVVKQSLSRETDFLARYGGEEMVVVLPDTDLDGAQLVGQRLLGAVRSLAMPHAASEAAAVVTLSVGMTSAVPSSPEDGPALIAMADAALYQAKRSGRNLAVAAAAGA
jgi:hemerythrin